jgi:hypothetical protein
MIPEQDRVAHVRLQQGMGAAPTPDTPSLRALGRRLSRLADPCAPVGAWPGDICFFAADATLTEP